MSSDACFSSQSRQVNISFRNYFTQWCFKIRKVTLSFRHKWCYPFPSDVSFRQMMLSFRNVTLSFHHKWRYRFVQWRYPFVTSDVSLSDVIVSPNDVTVSSKVTFRFAKLRYTFVEWRYRFVTSAQVTLSFSRLSNF